jgi:RNA polymerase sigma factor (sigma-70 family)
MAELLNNLPPEELTDLCGFLLNVLRPMVRHHHDTEDLVQDALLKALAQKELGCIRAWTRTVARRDGITLLQRTRQRTKRLGRRIDLDRAYLPADSSGDRDEELHEAVQAAVEGLPRQLRHIVREWMRGHTFPEIAALIGTHENTARRRFKQALQRLRSSLEACR